MSLLVLLVLEHDDTETDVTGGHQKWSTGNTNETELPSKDTTDNETGYESGERLDNTTDTK